MPIIQENEAEKTAEALAEAWRRPETFALVAQKSGVDPGWLAAAMQVLPPVLQRDHFCLLTSGSTGQPKLVVGSRPRAEQLTRVLHDVQDSAPVLATIGMLPLSYCYAFVNQWLWARTHRRSLVLTRGLGQPGAVLDALQVTPSSMLCLVGSQVPILLQHCAGRTFPGVIRIHFAGGRFPQERLDALRAVFPAARVFNNYGCVEAMPRLTVRPAEDGSVAHDIGLPIPGVELRATGEAELQFRSPYRAVAQVDPSGVRAIADDEWLSSGDLARQSESGHWELLGRSNEVFKRYGEKVAVPQLLGTLHHHWSGQAGHYRERDGRGEDGWVLVLCPPPGSAELRLVLQALRRAHPRTHWPLRIESVVEMPTLASGKPDAHALRCLAERTIHWQQRI